MRPSIPTLFLLGIVLMTMARPAHAAESLTLHYEWGPTPSGPWQTMDPDQVQVHANGAATVEPVEEAMFFRVRIAGTNGVGSLPLVRVRDVPASVMDLATRHIRDLADSPDEALETRGDLDDAGRWADAVVAPYAFPLHVPGARGAGPSLLELKLIRPRAASRTRETFLRNLSPDAGVAEDRGYLLVSLDRDDLPVLQFATEGPTPAERLLRRTRGQAPARIVRYGPTFWAAEDASGNLIANWGTEPFRIPHEYVNQMDARHTGIMDSETGVFERPPLARVGLTPYGSYEEMKADLAGSPVHQLYRERRARHARAIWAIEDGQLPPILEVAPGQTNDFLTGETVQDLVIHWEDDERSLAEVETLRTGGFRAIGRQAGSAPVTYRTPGGEVRRAALLVRGGGRPVLSVPGVKKSVKTTTVGAGWADQMYYYQLEHDDWCDLVGCGPTALAMLFGWWDRKGVPSAFYTGIGDTGSYLGSDAPQHIHSAAAKSRLRQVYHVLHDYCDVICFPTTDAGATTPGDLVEGFYGYAIAPILSGHLGLSASWAYDSWGDDWISSGSRVATGIQKGQPGVIGLGVLWHYGVAYSYRRVDYSINAVVILRQRFFKVNEGWPSFSPSWYSAYDVFLGISARMWQKKFNHEP